MNLHRVALMLYIILLSSLTIVAQSEDVRIQEFFLLLNEDNEHAYIDLFGMNEGSTLYVYAESYEVDTFVAICDIDCASGFFEFNNDIDGRRDRNSAFEYEFEEDGDFSIYIRDCCDPTASGIVRVLIGLDIPEVMTGDPYPTGDPLAVVYQPTYIDLSEIGYAPDDTQVQQFYGSIDEETPFVMYEIRGATQGQTLYLYAESEQIDTAVAICTERCDDFLVLEDDISSSNLNTSVEYRFPRDGDYRIIVTDCCEEAAQGRFRLLLGYNNFQISKGNILPNGAQIASVYEVPRHLLQTRIERNTELIRENCEEVDVHERPELSGDEETVETDNFVIHYTTEGDDEVDIDYVDEVVEFVELVLEVQIEELGWPLPLPDCGEGGDARYDFYLIDIYDGEGILGYADVEEIIGDNPNSDIEEEWGAYGYMVIDNDYDGEPAPLVIMRATIAHEFHHLIQFSYDVAEEDNWLYEATSSWMETVTSEEEDATDYTSSVFNQPDLCIGNTEDPDSVRLYGEWLLIDSIAQDFGNDAIITLWETIAVEDDMDAFYEFLEIIDTTPEDVLRRYAVRNLLLDYDLGDIFPTTVDVEEFIEDFETYDSGRHPIQDMAVQYLFIRESDVYTFELDNDDLTMVIVGINPDDDEVDIFEIGTEGTVDTNPYDYAYLLIMNTNQHDDPDDCNDEDWELEVSDGSDEDLAEPNGESFNVSNFDPAD